MRQLYLLATAFLVLISCAQTEKHQYSLYDDKNTHNRHILQQFKNRGAELFCDQPSYLDCFRIDREQCLSELTPLNGECFDYATNKLEGNISDKSEKFGQLYSLCMASNHLLIHGDENVDKIGSCLSNISWDKNQAEQSLAPSKKEVLTFTIPSDEVDIEELRNGKLKRPIRLEPSYPQNNSKRTSSKNMEPLKLRSDPMMLSIEDVKRAIKKHNFFDKDFNPYGNFRNDYVDNNDGTITDRATDLMWAWFSLPPEQQGAFPINVFEHVDPVKYTQRMNNIKYCGYSDWRLPTVEELASLLSNGNHWKGIHIDMIFHWDVYTDWGFITADKRREDNRYWKVNFDMGTVIPNYGNAVGYIRCWRQSFIPIRLVRNP